MSPLPDIAVDTSGLKTDDTHAVLDEMGNEEYQRQSSSIRTSAFDILAEARYDNALSDRDVVSFMKEYEEAALEASGYKTHDDKLQWLRMMGTYAKQRVTEAKRKTQIFLDQIREAQTNEWISDRSADGWRKRLADRKDDWSAHSEFLDSFKSNYLDNWKKLHTDLQHVEKQRKKLMPQYQDLEELKKLDDPEFADQHYKKRRGAVSAALAAIAVAQKNEKKMDSLHEDAKVLLTDAAKRKVMGKDKVGEWMESLFNRNRRPAEVQKIIQKTLPSYISAWTKTKIGFDQVVAKMDQHGIPPGFKRYEIDEFLELNFHKRESYVREANYAFEMNVRGPQKELDNRKLRIRHDLATKDWDGAQAELDAAWPLVLTPEDNAELKSMQRYLTDFRSKEEETPAEDSKQQRAAEILDGMRQSLALVPPSVQQLYIDALQMGYGTTRGLMTQLYNLVWCHDNGYLPPDKQIALGQSARGETERILRDGHSKRGLENIDLDCCNESEKGDAMRDYDGVWAPTLIHMDATNGSSRSTYLNAVGQKENEDYWSTLRLKNISYEKQAFLVRNVNWKFKKGIRDLENLGFGFALTGPPVPRN